MVNFLLKFYIKCNLQIVKIGFINYTIFMILFSYVHLTFHVITEATHHKL